MTPEQVQAWRWEKELDERNRPLSDEELDALFPQDGYKVTHYLVFFSKSFLQYRSWHLPLVINLFVLQLVN